MATVSIPTPRQAPPFPRVSTIGVGTLVGNTSILNPKKPGCSAKAAASKEAEPSPETKALIKTVLDVGKEWQSKRKTVKDYFEQHKLEVLKLRNEFGVMKGTKGKMLNVPQPDGTTDAMYWSDFVSLAFDVSERHINRLLGIPVEPPNPPDPANSKNYKLGFAAGQEAAMRGQVQAPAVAQPVSKLDKGDPYAYFEKLKDEKPTFASELAAMVVEMFEPTDADEIVQEFGKEVKRQQQLRNAEAARRDLDKLAEEECQQTKAGAKNTALKKNEPNTKAMKKFLIVGPESVMLSARACFSSKSVFCISCSPNYLLMTCCLVVIRHRITVRRASPPTPVSTSLHRSILHRGYRPRVHHSGGQSDA